MNEAQSCDVLIIGAGMAGGLLARQLSLEQLDRAKFDRDLCEINRNAGVDVRLGTAVIAADQQGQPGIKLDPDGMHRPGRRVCHA